MGTAAPVASLDGPTSGYVREVAARVGDVLGEALRGVYLYGSGAHGGFVPGRSDVDVAAVSARALTGAEKDALLHRLRHAALPCPARKLELVVYSEAAVARPAGGVWFEANLNTGAGLDDHFSTDPRAEPGFWFVIDLAMIREQAVALLGPPAGRLIAPLPRPVVLTALDESLAWHLSRDDAGHDAVLNACRAWRFARERRWSSKVDAGEWAKERLDDPAPVAAALARRAGDATARWSDADVRRFVAGVRSSLRTEAAGADEPR